MIGIQKRESFLELKQTKEIYDLSSVILDAQQPKGRV